MLGSYMNNLALNLQRIIPFMQRCGDLMQRESLLSAPRDRHLTEEMAHNIGRAFEDIARATGSVAHFYRDIRIGE